MHVLRTEKAYSIYTRYVNESGIVIESVIVSASVIEIVSASEIQDLHKSSGVVGWF